MEHGARVVGVIAFHGVLRRLAALLAHAAFQRRRAAELAAVVMLCERRRLADLSEQDASHKLLALRSWRAGV